MKVLFCHQGLQSVLDKRVNAVDGILSLHWKVKHFFLELGLSIINVTCVSEL